MRVNTLSNEILVTIDDRREKNATLAALICSTFLLAKPVGLLNRRIFQPSQRLSRSDAEALILEQRDSAGCVVNIEFLYGRECRLKIYEKGSTEFAIDKRYFERFRRDLDEVLVRAADDLAQSWKCEREVALPA